ncbi:hypothetical protein HRbin34_00561 [bacterium HR34]|nr:hypothetical protein HRbin34_00561 [bacterium HR34]
MIQLTPVFLSLIALTVVFYIFSSKRKAKPLVCPLGHDCNEVVTSEYSKFLGIPLEYLGMFYFSSVAAVYSFMYFTGGVHSYLYFFLVLLSGISFVFSIYLLSVQRFILKSWCTLCLFCSSISILILFFVLAYPMGDIKTIILNNSEIVKIIYSSGLSFGIGISLLLDLFLFKFLKDFRISFFENYILKLGFQILWVVIVIAGGGLIMMYYLINNSDIFIFNFVVFLVMLVASFILTLISVPQLIKQSNGKDYNLLAVRKLVKLSLASGSVALASWYILAIYFYSNYVFDRLSFFVFAYLIMLAASISSAFLIEKKMAQSSMIDEEDKD